MKRRSFFGGIVFLFALFVLIWASGPSSADPPSPLVPSADLLAVDNPLWRIGGSLEALDVQDDYAYLAQGNRLCIVDLSTWQTMGTLSFRYPVRDVAVRSNESEKTYAYLVTNTYGDLHVVDVTDPTDPTAVGKGEVPGWRGGESVVVSGDYAYVLADGASDGLLVTFDITSPITPTFVTQTVGVGIYGRWVRAGTNHLYVLNDNRLTIFDVTTADAPEQVGAFTGLYGAANLDVAEPYVYVTAATAAEGSGVFVIDVSDRTNPEEADRWLYDFGNGDALGVAVSGDYAYVGYNDGGGTYSAIFVLDATDPTNLAYNDDKYQPIGSFYNFLVEGTTLYVAGGPSGDLLPVSIASPTDPTLDTSLRQPGRAEMVRLSGERVYAVGPADYHGADTGIWVYDVSDPLTPTLAHQEDPYPVGVYDLEIAGEQAYMCVYGYGLAVADAADFAPRGSYAPNGVAYYCTDVAVEGGTAYVVAPSASVFITDAVDVIDVSAPDHPSRVGSVPTAATDLRQVVADGDRLYAADYDTQILVFDIAAPQNPTLAATYTLTGLITLHPAGDYLYAGTQDGLTILDVRDPGDIQPVGDPFDTLNAVAGIDVVDEIAYLSCAGEAYALAVSNPITPTRLWEYDGLASEGLDIQGQPPFALVADGDLGLTLHAIADGVVRPSAGSAATMFPQTDLVVRFAQDMDTESVTFTCDPDPGGWEASWGATIQSEAATGRVLTLRHNPFAENQDYVFQITGGTTAQGQAIAPFGLDFSVVEVWQVYLPLVLR